MDISIKRNDTPNVIKEPAIRVTAMPTDLNPYGGVLGGGIMNRMTLAVGSFDAR